MVDYTSENLTTPTTFNDLGKLLTTPKIVLKNQGVRIELYSNSLKKPIKNLLCCWSPRCRSMKGNSTNT